MLCSPPELGLPGDPGGILVLGDGLEPGTPLREALGIESDVLYDLEINPNRPDAMSVAGVARDLAAHYGVPFAIPTPDIAGVATGPPAAVARHRRDRRQGRVRSVHGRRAARRRRSAVATRRSRRG